MKVEIFDRVFTDMCRYMKDVDKSSLNKVWLGLLCKNENIDDKTCREVNGDGYGRICIATRNDEIIDTMQNISNDPNKIILSNIKEISFIALSDWGVIDGFAIYTEPIGGYMIYNDDLTDDITIYKNMKIIFRNHNMKLTNECMDINKDFMYDNKLWYHGDDFNVEKRGDFLVFKHNKSIEEIIDNT